jgi:hypothetical protein
MLLTKLTKQQHINADDLKKLILIPVENYFDGFIFWLILPIQ